MTQTGSTLLRQQLAGSRNFLAALSRASCRVPAKPAAVSGPGRDRGRRRQHDRHLEPRRRYYAEELGDIFGPVRIASSEDAAEEALATNPKRGRIIFGRDHGIDGAADANVLTGGAGDDEIFGGSGADELNGGAGDDYLDGGIGNDILRGGADNNIYDGGKGFDTYEVALGSPLTIIYDSDGLGSHHADHRHRADDPRRGVSKRWPVRTDCRATRRATLPAQRQRARHHDVRRPRNPRDRLPRRRGSRSLDRDRAISASSCRRTRRAAAAAAAPAHAKPCCRTWATSIRTRAATPLLASSANGAAGSTRPPPTIPKSSTCAASRRRVALVPHRRLR